MTNENDSDELEFHKYEGSKVPRLIRMLWTIFIIFSLVYLIRYALPDLGEWIDKL